MSGLLCGIDHVQLAGPPGCEEEARRFFGGLLGLPELEKPHALRARGGVWFSCGAQQVHVGVEPGVAPQRKAHPAFRAAGREELDALAACLGAAGHAVQWDGEIPGVRRFYAPDPWGNRLEFLADES